MQKISELIIQLRERGYRITPQRQMVLNALWKKGGHATALEVYSTVTDEFPGLNKATVYRTLDFLADEKIVTRSELNGRLLYELAGEEPHHHLHCTNCGNMTHLDNHHFADLLTHLAHEHHFKANLSHLVIPGLCRNCQESMDTK
ncbi:MAG: Fur family transcriptional regulator [Chloroflexota bacterium]